MRGPETERSHNRRLESGFYARFMSGFGLDIGYKGEVGDEAEPALASATGVDLGFPGYNGVALPQASESQDYVYASHVLEHLDQPYICIREWFRVLKPGGHLVIMVPHQWLYERKTSPPSRWNEDHKTFFTPAFLLRMIELSLSINTYRIRHLADNDEKYDYAVRDEEHARGCYEIELVIQKL